MQKKGLSFLFFFFSCFFKEDAKLPPASLENQGRNRLSQNAIKTSLTLKTVGMCNFTRERFRGTPVVVFHYLRVGTGVKGTALPAPSQPCPGPWLCPGTCKYPWARQFVSLNPSVTLLIKKTASKSVLCLLPPQFQREVVLLFSEITVSVLLTHHLPSLPRLPLLSPVLVLF